MDGCMWLDGWMDGWMVGGVGWMDGLDGWMLVGGWGGDGHRGLMHIALDLKPKVPKVVGSNPGSGRKCP